MEKEKIKEFTKLYEDTFKKNLSMLIIKYKIPSRDVEDLLQQIYVSFYENYLEGFDSTQSKMITYFSNYMNMQINSYFHKFNIESKRKVSIDSMVGETIYTTLDGIAAEEPVDNSYSTEKMEIINQIIGTFDDKMKSHYNALLRYNSG